MFSRNEEREDFQLKLVELKPIRVVPSEWDEIEKRIKRLFKKYVYIPLLKELSLSSKTFKNSKDDLLEAIRSGRLTFHRGKFSGKLNATLSRELRDLGARWDRVQKCYSIPLADLPIDVRNAISGSAWRFEQKLGEIDKKLEEVVPEKLATELKISDLFDRTLWKVESEFQKSIDNITVSPKLTKDQSERISKEWQDNMNIWIKDFTKQEITRLRQEVRKSVFAGNRYGSLVKTIQDSYGVTARKAKFLARQETHLLMTKFTEVRYQDAGVNEYKWRSVVGTAKHPVRPRHKALNDASQSKGEIFRFDKPPITSEPGEPERHNNPGQDYNCRCTAVPIVRFRIEGKNWKMK